MVARGRGKPTTATVAGKKVRLPFPGAAPPFTKATAKKAAKKKGK